jgi:two-component system nitrogen regulation sensor histidine kinase NtrY
MQEIVSKRSCRKMRTSADLTEALDVVATRSRGLVNFVDAYRSFTAIPIPKFEEISAKKLLDRVVSLSAAEHKYLNIKVEYFIRPEDLCLTIDAAQIEMTLINLVKNAREAYSKCRALR